jgi:hypothetical protein
MDMDDRADAAATRQLGYLGQLRRPLTQSRLFDAITSVITYQPMKESAGRAVDSAPASIKGLHLLVAEDNEMNQFVTQETLRRAGCTCDIVSDGALALDAFRRRGYDAILMDCQSEVFDGPGAERLTLLKAGKIQAIPPEEWPAARLVPVPCLRLLALRYPVQEYATGVRKKENPLLPDPEPTWLAVSRIDYVVRRWTLSRVQFELLEGLISGLTVGAAIEKAAHVAIENGQSLDHLAEDLRAWFQQWSAAGFFQAIDSSVK